jgi:hypothetical protein
MVCSNSSHTVMIWQFSSYFHPDANVVNWVFTRTKFLHLHQLKVKWWTATHNTVKSQAANAFQLETLFLKKNPTFKITTYYIRYRKCTMLALYVNLMLDDSKKLSVNTAMPSCSRAACRAASGAHAQ